MSDIKGLPADTPMPKPELMELFASYAEDYNTHSLPHKKYYDMEAWDQAIASGREVEVVPGATASTDNTAGMLDLRAEEEARRQQRIEMQRQSERDRLRLLMNSMDPSRMEGLKQQQALQLAGQYAFKTGNMKEVDRIQKKLTPDA